MVKRYCVVLASLFFVLAFVIGVGSAQSNVISVERASWVQENQVSVPLVITPDPNVPFSLEAFNLEVLYDPNDLQPGIQDVNGVKYIDPQNTLTSAYDLLGANPIAPGRLAVGGATLTPTVGGGLFLNVLFTVRPGIDRYRSTMIDLSLVQDSGNGLANFEVTPLSMYLLSLPPVVDSIPPQTIYVDEMFRFVVNASDVNLDPLVFSLGVNAPQGSYLNSLTGLFVWVPTQTQVGVFDFDLSVSDGVYSPVVVPLTVSVLAYPSLTSMEPANESAGVDRSSSVKAVFSRDMASATINSNSFVLKDNSGMRVPGRVYYSNKVAVLTPMKPLNSNVVYTATVTRAVKDIMGNSLDSEYSWSFTTEPPALIPPVITETTPVSDEVDVPVYDSVAASFSEDLNPLTVNFNSFVLKDNSGMRVPGRVYYGSGVVTFKPVKPLKNNVVYTATIAKTVKDVFGNALAADYSWSFTTASSDTAVLEVSSTAPANADIGVSLKPVLKVTFNKPVNRFTLNTNSFTLKDDMNRTVSGIVVVADNAVTFKPMKPLNSGTMYTATIKGSVKDYVGNVLGNDYSWSFTTELPDLIPPAVTANSPASDSVNVDLTSSVTASFSEDLNPLTVNFNSFVLKDNRGMRVPGRVYYGSGVATFKPVKPLKNNVVYTATIAKTVKDVFGNALAADYSWSFRTAVLV